MMIVTTSLVGLMAVSLLLMDPVYKAIQAGSIGEMWCFVLLFMFIAGFEFGPGTLFAVIVNETLPEQVCIFSLLSLCC